MPSSHRMGADGDLIEESYIVIEWNAYQFGSPAGDVSGLSSYRIMEDTYEL